MGFMGQVIPPRQDSAYEKWREKWRADEAAPAAKAAVSAPLSFGKIVWAVVLGNLITGALGLLIYAGMSKP